MPKADSLYERLAILWVAGKVWNVGNVSRLVVKGAWMNSSDAQYVTIAEACKRLGIAPNTLRSWGAGGKIQEYRHPVNNYRLYSLDDIHRLAAVLRRPIKVGRGAGKMSCR